MANTPLAVDRDAPMLITHSESLVDPVAAEIQRVLGDDTSKTVYLLGGSAALSKEVRADVEALGYDVQRLAGESRFHTATAIAERFFAAPPAVGLARSGDFPDALTGGTHIGALTATGDSGPMLLTPGTRLAAPVADYLCATNSISEVAIYGGSAAIGSRIADAIDTAVDGSGCSGGDPADASLTNTSVLHPRGVGLAQVGLTLHDLMVISSGDEPVDDPRDGIVARATTHGGDGGVITWPEGCA